MREVVPLAGGANNRVYRVEVARAAQAVEVVLPASGRSARSVGAEFAFARFARAAGIPCVPKPLANDSAAGLGLFEFVEGERAEIATELLIAAGGRLCPRPQRRDAGGRRRQCSRTLRNRASRSRSTSDSSAAASTGSARLRRIRMSSARRSDSFAALCFQGGKRFVTRRNWQFECPGRRRRGRSSRSRRCVSPSDFGFHNALVGPDGRAVFLDFEYAGWDDPAKLDLRFLLPAGGAGSGRALQLRRQFGVIEFLELGGSDGPAARSAPGLPHEVDAPFA